MTFILAAVAASAAAQSEPATHPHLYAGAGIVADNDHTWGDDVQVVPALGVVAGVDVTPFVGVRLSVDIPETIVTTWQNGSTGAVYAGINRHRSTTWSGLLDVHRPLGRRAKIGFITGVAWAVRPDQYVVTVDTPATGTAPPRHDEYRTDHRFTWVGLTAGVEAPIAVRAKVAVVPELRVIGFPLAEYGNTTIVRAGVALRVWF